MIASRVSWEELADDGLRHASDRHGGGATVDDDLLALIEAGLVAPHCDGQEYRFRVVEAAEGSC
jgi:hypothetical protein